MKGRKGDPKIRVDKTTATANFIYQEGELTTDIDLIKDVGATVFIDIKDSSCTDDDEFAVFFEHPST
jgi:hypothetical protein